MASDGEALRGTSSQEIQRNATERYLHGDIGDKSLADIGMFRSFLPWSPSNMCEMDHASRERVAICRIAWFVVLWLCFFYVQTNMMIDQELTAGLRQEVTDEFFPDAGKASERLKEGEVTAGVKERMHADDVAQTLNWYSTFCRLKASNDDHIMDAWKCRLTQVAIGESSKPVWDIFENRGFPSDESEDPSTEDRKIGMGARDIDPERRARNDKYIHEGLSAIDNICNDRFLSWHLGRGDDPLGKLGRTHVPFGNATAFSEQILQPKGVTKDINDAYDEYTILDHNSMFTDLSDQMDKHLELTEKLDGIEKLDAKVDNLDEHVKSLAGKASSSRAANSSLAQLSPAKGRSATVGQPFPAAVFVRNPRQSLKRTLHDHRPGARKRGRSQESLTQLVAEAGSLPTEPELEARSKPRTAFRRPKQDPSLRESQNVATFFPGGFLQRSAKPLHANSSDRDTSNVSEFREGGTDQLDYDFAVWQHDEDEKLKKSARDEEEEDYGAGCFETTDIVGMLLDEFIEADMDSSGSLNRKEAIMLLADIFDLDLRKDKAKVISYLGQLDKSGDSYVTVDEFLDFVKARSSHIRTRERGFLSEACRNHHWGLISVCKPRQITAEFRVQNVRRHINGFVDLGAYLDVTIQFKEVGQRHGSGWYQAYIDIDAEEPPGSKSWKCFVAATITTILIILLVFADAFYTILLWPCNFLALWRFGSEPGFLDEIQDEEKRYRKWQELITIIKSFVDGRQVKMHFLSLEYLAMELLIAIVFIVVVVISAIDAFSPQIVPMGRTTGNNSPRCLETFMSEDIEWAEKLLRGSLTTKRGMSPISYMRFCMEWRSKVELFFEILIEVVYAHQLHAYVAALLCLRILQMFEYWERTKWLPLTIKIAYGKLCNFMIMYLFVVASYACLFFMIFGRLYAQFDSFSSACWALMLYSFGFTFRAEDGTHPFIETSGTLVIVFLWFFMITVVTVGLNFFTTIILDAFARASDPEFDEQELLVDAVSSFSWISVFVNVPPEIFKGPELKATANEPTRGSFMRRFSQRESLKPAQITKRESLASIEEEDESQAEVQAESRDTPSSSPEDASEKMRKKLEARKAAVEASST